ncbi:MAG: Glycosyl transferase family 39 [candidate division WWE3 bacterium GW2011_GWA1_41_8]|uniref:Glycosyl transferase family 39 n=1 Tax=candidate division WWE3 bacterium GW2011_GWA1_41_8 TaxID=1619103 RepID=A0A0G1A7Q7_UNCKA|nr:MAG: Glycosyl transferase family 39 [candidate division WWE3 bacterium GW2011_GWA1_41_8]
MTIIVTLIAAWLRLINLGYSDYQGDEIKALFLPAEGQSISEFLLDQRKGPIQFIITGILKFFNPEYDNQLLMRLPFAIAGILTVLFFYKLIKIHFGRKIAFYASFFIATNGFFIAFSRIVQYQSFVILFAVLALYCFTLVSTQKKWTYKGIYLGFIFWALSILSHYDGVFIAPFAFYLIYKWYLQAPTGLKERRNHLMYSMLLSGAVLATFYIPFVISISASTMSYWQGRLAGTGGKISSSRYLFSVYQPIYVIHIYIGLTLLGIAETAIRKNLLKLSIMFWFLLPFTFFELIVGIPGTHIFNYILPVTIIMAMGIDFGEEIIKKFLGWLAAKILVGFGVSIVFIFIFLQSTAVFVDHTREYPWEPEFFLVWEFPKPVPNFHLSMFGFPYFRHWEAISEIVNSTEHNGYYSTNERSSISRYYIPLKKSSDAAGYYIYIVSPQSFTDLISSDRVRIWTENYKPVMEFTDAEGRTISQIYYLTPGPLINLDNEY